MAQNEYIPGVCNIGPEETSRRRNLGWVSLAIAIVLLAILLGTGANVWWRLLIFLPATISASGFLQAYFHFCSGFARQGVFNFAALGNMQKVADENSKVKDSKRGSQITWYAAAIGIVITIISIVI